MRGEWYSPNTPGTKIPSRGTNKLGTRYILREWKSAQDELRALLRDEYQDYDLVVALANGRPCEDRIILKSFEKLREKAGLPKVVFHSLRHSSTTYKLKLNHGDLKATQGNTGHAQIDMITSVYAPGRGLQDQRPEV